MVETSASREVVWLVVKTAVATVVMLDYSMVV